MPAFIKVTVRATSLESYNVAVERISWATTVYWEGRYGSPLWQTGAFMFIYAEKFITRMLNLKPYEKRYIEVTVKAARRPVWAKG